MRRSGGAKVHLHSEQHLDPGIGYWIKRGFDEFMALPSAIALGGILLAVLVYLLDRDTSPFLEPLRSFLSGYIFPDPEGTLNFLTTITGGLMTVTSITISVLVVALQQSISSMGGRVFGQFIRRRINQATLGILVGAVLYALVTLATTQTDRNPIFAAAVGLVLTALSMFMLIVIMYTTMNQIIPEVVIGAIHDQTLAARAQQAPLIQRTRREPSYDGPYDLAVRAKSEGYITRIDLGMIEAAIREGKGRIEVHLIASIGAYVMNADLIADIEAEYEEDADRMDDAIYRALTFSRQRDILYDASYGLEQLEAIAWTSISSAKSDPIPGLIAIRSAGDLLSHWIREGKLEPQQTGDFHVVYHDDVMDQLMEVLESSMVAAYESRQHMSIREVYNVLSAQFAQMDADVQRRAADLFLRSLPALEGHILTYSLGLSLDRVVRTLRESGYPSAAGEVQAAREKMLRKIETA